MTIQTSEDDNIEIISNNIRVVFKHNDIGISVDYYNNDTEEEPFRADQVWWDDVPTEKEDDDEPE